jgi:hypothetical protein
MKIDSGFPPGDKMTIKKHEKGFIVQSGDVASYPYIKKRVWKFLYPWALGRAALTVSRYRQAQTKNCEQSLRKLS